MMQYLDITWTWVGLDGREVPDKVVRGYRLSDYFNMDLDDLADQETAQDVHAMLSTAYKGADFSGIGLQWSIWDEPTGKWLAGWSDGSPMRNGAIEG